MKSTEHIQCEIDELDFVTPIFSVVKIGLEILLNIRDEIKRGNDMKESDQIEEIIENEITEDDYQYTEKGPDGEEIVKDIINNILKDDKLI